MKTIRTIILIVICLYVGAFIGKERMIKGTEKTIEKTKICCAWIKGTWNKEVENKDKEA